MKYLGAGYLAKESNSPPSRNPLILANRRAVSRWVEASWPSRGIVDERKCVTTRPRGGGARWVACSSVVRLDWAGIGTEQLCPSLSVKDVGAFRRRHQTQSETFAGKFSLARAARTSSTVRSTVAAGWEAPPRARYTGQVLAPMKLCILARISSSCFRALSSYSICSKPGPAGVLPSIFAENAATIPEKSLSCSSFAALCSWHRSTHSCDFDIFAAKIGNMVRHYPARARPAPQPDKTVARSQDRTDACPALPA